MSDAAATMPGQQPEVLPAHHVRAAAARDRRGWSAGTRGPRTTSRTTTATAMPNEKLAATSPGQHQSEQDLLGGVRGGRDGVDAKTGSANFLESRSCISSAVAIGRPSMIRFMSGLRAHDPPSSVSPVRKTNRPNSSPSPAAFQGPKCTITSAPLRRNRQPPAAPKCGGRQRDLLRRPRRLSAGAL